MNPYLKLLTHIKESVALASSEEDLISDRFKIISLKKKEFLLKEGEVSSYMRFIAKGCLRSYYTDDDGHEHILQFGIEGWWINDLYSYLTNTPARHHIQAIEESVVLQIHRDALEGLFTEVPAVERFFRLKMQNAYVALQERTIFNISKTAEEHYLHFIKKYRDIEQRIPQYMIASYLGITPEFLSTIRKDLLHT